jgi:hypothetical protein
VAHDVIYRNTAWECNTALKLLCLFALESLVHLCLDVGVDGLANRVDVGSVHTEGNRFLQSL